MKDVTIYTTPSCGWCRIAKQFFQHYNIPYTEKNVASDPVARGEMVAKSQQLGVPVIDVGGDVVVGFNQPKLIELLELSQAH